ncbi:MAG TPA: hypothetical protein VF499_02930 [Afipia sp.]
MATNPPDDRCFICNGKLDFRVVETRRPTGGFWFGPTEYEQLPHDCPPGAAAAWFERIVDRTPRRPFFTKVGT